MPTRTNMLSGLTIAPTMQAIVVDCVPIVEPQLAAVIGDNAEVVMPCPEDSQAASPTHCKVIASFESGPFLACVAIVNSMAPTSHVRFATVQVLATTTLTKVESILPEEAMAINCTMGNLPRALCAYNNPFVSSIRPLVPEEHPSMTSTLEHL